MQSRWQTRGGRSCAGSPYDCAKFAAVGFSQELRAEVLKDGIVVTTVVPSLMRTGSHINAWFKGKHRAEFSWFSLGASTPLSAMRATRAAHQIIDALCRGDAEVTLSIQAQAVARIHGLFPGFTADVLSIVNRLLPTSGGGGSDRHRGTQSSTAISESVLTAPGRSAARATHKLPATEPAAKAE